ncbi:hypothetical protein [uncultured Helicobacter sp.]|nr:hypothetical protein [Candidatus Helicobacter avicola]
MYRSQGVNPHSLAHICSESARLDSPDSVVSLVVDSINLAYICAVV